MMPDTEERFAEGVDALLRDPSYLEQLRRQMLKFATLQLHDQGQAEDAVQEALIGAMNGARRFAGRAALKTWVFAILKNKIADILRQRERMINASSLLPEEGEDEDYSELFDSKGFWQLDERPVRWGNPDEALQNRQFWQVFEICLNDMPPRQARLFMMKEFIELDTDEICKAVGVTVNNLFVTLHRARLRLRECLETRWVEGTAES